jgi:hypothetical protein
MSSAHAGGAIARQASAEASNAAAGTFTADVAIRQTYTGSGAGFQAASPALTLRVTGSLASSGPTAITLTGVERPVVRSAAGARLIDNPFIVSRMEYDERGGLRLYNSRGERVRVPEARDRAAFVVGGSLSRQAGIDTNRVLRDRRPASPAGGWADRLVARREERVRRRQLLELAHGAPVGRVAGLDRYLSATEEGLDEVLADPDTALPVEINTVHGGRLVARARFGYEQLDERFLVRRRVSAERVLPDAAGARVVTEIDVTNVHVDAGGLR